eukprot:TRINITY_DN46848_c0_g1_i1.p1 TRINITY_DN46848_c0_g1~~TRINITY_DN46848_c0_g1_i1.p1  ORF type:complete len:100 (+),score=16.79 TRINITY_DN46848_c0_g1_i1:39-302(+)
MCIRDSYNTTLPNISDTAPRFDSPRPGSPHATKPIRQILPTLLTSHKEYDNDAPINPDEITYDMFKAAFLNPSNACLLYTSPSPRDS